MAVPTARCDRKPASCQLGQETKALKLKLVGKQLIPNHIRSGQCEASKYSVSFGKKVM